MNYSPGYRGGFTLVEIMIVVTIIGLLAALAVPAWQKTRRVTICNLMDNDARQLVGAAHQYFMEHGTTTVAVGYLGAASGGAITGPLSDHVRFIGVQYTPFSIDLAINGTFSLEHPFLEAPRTYDLEGHHIP